MCLESTKLNIDHPYSDNLNIDLFAYCYKLEEIFAEKVRALAERARPRGLYDVISLFKYKLNLIDNATFLSLLKQKCAFKNINCPTFDSILNHPKFNELNREWNNILKHQVPDLEEIEIHLKELELFFIWLYLIN